MKKDFIWHLERILIWIAIIITFLLSVMCIFTTNYSKKGEQISRISKDNVLVNVLVFVIIIGILTGLRYFVRKKKIKISLKLFCGFMMAFIFTAGMVWIFSVRCISHADQRMIVKSAVTFIDGNWAILQKNYYMYIYPFQLGITAYAELVFRIVGRESDRALQCINVASLPFTYFFMYKITRRIFPSKTTGFLVILLCITCLPLFFFLPFVYGDVITLAFITGALLGFLKYMDSGKMKWSFLVIALITIATQLKTNTKIAMIAFIMLYVFWGIRKKKIIIVIQAVILLVCVQLANVAVIQFYEYRSGMEITEGAPRILHIAMGLQEGGRAAGWYNGFSLYPYMDNDCDPVIATALAKEALGESLQGFIDNPGYMLDFFYRKTSSQWVDPTYNSFLCNDFYCNEPTGVVKSIVEGDLNKGIETFMDHYQFLLIFSSCGLFFLRRKKMTLDQMGAMIIFLGGFAFHLIWEANGRYCMPYFVLLIPYGAAGLTEFMDLIQNKLNKGKNTNRDNLATEATATEEAVTEATATEVIPVTEHPEIHLFNEEFEIVYEDPYAMPDDASMRE